MARYFHKPGLLVRVGEGSPEVYSWSRRRWVPDETDVLSGEWLGEWREIDEAEALVIIAQTERARPSTKARETPRHTENGTER